MYFYIIALIQLAFGIFIIWYAIHLTYICSDESYPFFSTFFAFFFPIPVIIYRLVTCNRFKDECNNNDADKD